MGRLVNMFAIGALASQVPVDLKYYPEWLGIDLFLLAVNIAIGLWMGVEANKARFA